MRQMTAGDVIRAAAERRGDIRTYSYLPSMNGKWVNVVRDDDGYAAYSARHTAFTEAVARRMVDICNAGIAPSVALFRATEACCGIQVDAARDAIETAVQTDQAVTRAMADAMTDALVSIGENESVAQQRTYLVQLEAMKVRVRAKLCAAQAELHEIQYQTAEMRESIAYTRANLAADGKVRS